MLARKRVEIVGSSVIVVCLCAVDDVRVCWPGQVLSLWSHQLLLCVCLCSAWCQGVLAMVWDQETSIQDKCLEIVESTLLANITHYYRSGLRTSPHSETLIPQLL